MKHKVTKASITAALCLLLVACGANSSITKAYVQLAFNTFIAAEAIYNPGWHSAKLAADIDRGIAAWGVGAGWQTNVINELVLAQGDMGDIPNCNAQCQAVAIVFEGAIASAILILQQQSGARLATTTPQMGGKPVPLFLKNGKFDKAAYKAEFNKVSPPAVKMK